MNIYTIVPWQDRVFVGVQSDTPTAPQGRVLDISLGTGRVDTFDVDGVAPYFMGVAAGALFYTVARDDSASPDAYRTAKVFRRDLASGETRELPNPADVPSANVGLLTGNDRGDIVWTFGAEQRMQIAKWDPQSDQTAVLASSRDPVYLFADASTIYWQEPKGGRLSGQRAFFSMPIAGGAVSGLLEMAASSWNGPGLLAIDERELYYAIEDDEARKGLWSMPKQGGESRMVIPGARPLRLSSASIDDLHIYWTGFDEQELLRRTPKGGGPTESVWSGSLRWVQAVAVDACNLYWAVFNPSELLFRAK